MCVCVCKNLLSRHGARADLFSENIARGHSMKQKSIAPICLAGVGRPPPASNYRRGVQCAILIAGSSHCEWQINAWRESLTHPPARARALYVCVCHTITTKYVSWGGMAKSRSAPLPELERESDHYSIAVARKADDVSPRTAARIDISSAIQPSAPHSMGSILHITAPCREREENVIAEMHWACNPFGLFIRCKWKTPSDADLYILV